MVSLSILSMETEYGYDVVKVFDGIDSDDTKAKILAEMSGIDKHENIISSQEVMRIRFTSDWSNNMTGFQAAVVAFKKAELPDFTWNGPFSLNITFFNETTENIDLILAPGMEDTCAYQGSTAQTSVVISSPSSSDGCRSLDQYVEIMLLSKYLRKTSQGKKKNKAIYSLKNGQLKEITEDIFYSNFLINRERLDVHRERKKRSVEEGHSKVIQIRIQFAFDRSLLDKFITYNINKRYIHFNIRKRIRQLFVHAKMSLSSSTDELEIELILHKNIKFIGEYIKIDDSELVKSRKYQSLEHIPLVIFTKEDERSHIKGLSFRSGACREDNERYGVALVAWRDDGVKAGEVLAHEIAHLIGMAHDDERVDSNGIPCHHDTMEGEVSDCNIANIKYWFQFKGFRCFNKKCSWPDLKSNGNWTCDVDLRSCHLKCEVGFSTVFSKIECENGQWSNNFNRIACAPSVFFMAGGEGAHNNAEVYHPTIFKPVTIHPELPQGQTWIGHTTLVHQGFIYLCGGQETNRICNSMDVQSIDVRSESWNKWKTHQIPPRFGHKAIVIQNTMFFIGGYVKYKFFAEVISISLPLKNIPKFSTVTNVQYKGESPCVLKIDEESFVIIGGNNGGYKNDVIKYNITDKMLTSWTNMTTGRSSHFCALTKFGDTNWIVVGGGLNIEGTLQTTEALELNESSRWTQLGNLSISRYGAEMVVTKRGVMVMGGKDGNGDVLATVELLDWDDKSWTLVEPSLQMGRHFFGGAVEIPGALFNCELILSANMLFNGFELPHAFDTTTRIRVTGGVLPATVNYIAIGGGGGGVLMKNGGNSGFLAMGKMTVTGDFDITIGKGGNVYSDHAEHGEDTIINNQTVAKGGKYAAYLRKFGGCSYTNETLPGGWSGGGGYGSSGGGAGGTAGSHGYGGNGGHPWSCLGDMGTGESLPQNVPVFAGSGGRSVGKWGGGGGGITFNQKNDNWNRLYGEGYGGGGGAPTDRGGAGSSGAVILLSIESEEAQWSAPVDGCINGYTDETHTGVSMEQCKEKCVVASSCKSIEFNEKSKKCWLSSETKETKPDAWKEPCPGSYSDLIYLEHLELDGSLRHWCQVECPEPPKRNNGNWTYSVDKTTRLLTCEPGYISTYTTTKCSGGVWTNINDMECLPSIFIIFSGDAHEIYHPILANITYSNPPPPLEYNWIHHSSFVHHGVIYLCGGDETQAICNSLDMEQFIWKPHQIQSKYGHSTVVVQDTLYFIGGYSGNHYDEPISTRMPLDDTPQIESVPNLSYLGYLQCVVTINDQSFAITGGNHKSIVETPVTGINYNIKDEKATNLPRMIEGRYNHGCVVLEKDGKQWLVVGGGINNNEAKNTTEILNLNENKEWRKIGHLNMSRYGSDMIVTERGVMMIGGRDGNGIDLATVELLDWDKEEWSLVEPSLQMGRYSFGRAIEISASLFGCEVKPIDIEVCQGNYEFNKTYVGQEYTRIRDDMTVPQSCHNKCREPEHENCTAWTWTWNEDDTGECVLFNTAITNATLEETGVVSGTKYSCKPKCYELVTANHTVAKYPQFCNETESSTVCFNIVHLEPDEFQHGDSIWMCYEVEGTNWCHDIEYEDVDLMCNPEPGIVTGQTGSVTNEDQYPSHNGYPFHKCRRGKCNKPNYRRRKPWCCLWR